MSLVAYALRTTLQQALLNRTHAEDRVYDSLITPIAQLTQTEALPLIIVSTDDDEGDLREGNRRLTLSNRNLQIIIETTLAGGYTVEAGVATVDIPHTDDGMEKLLDFMAHRVRRAMLDPASPWADLFLGFLGTTKRFFSRRGASDENGTLFAARQLVIVCDPADEPDFGVPVDPECLWGQLLAKMRETDGLAGYADVLEAEILGAPLSDWQAEQARLGIRRDGATGIGFGPMRGLDDTPPTSRLEIHSGLGIQSLTP